MRVLEVWDRRMSVAETHKSGVAEENSAARFSGPPLVSFLTHLEFVWLVRGERALECGSPASTDCPCSRLSGRVLAYRIGDDADAVIDNSSLSFAVGKRLKSEVAEILLVRCVNAGEAQGPSAAEPQPNWCG